MTYLQIVNEVLKRLRENQVATVSASTYSSLVGTFVNQVKTEVESAWNWSALRQTITIPTVVATYNYSLTGAGSNFRILNAFNVQTRSELEQVPSSYIDRLFLSTSSNQSPSYYRLKGVDSNGDPKIDVWPIPNNIENLQFNLVVHQAVLSADTDVLLVPVMPVILGAYALAVSERGEDGGAGYTEVDAKYQKFLADAISQDIANFADETTAEVV